MHASFPVAPRKLKTLQTGDEFRITPFYGVRAKLHSLIICETYALPTKKAEALVTGLRNVVSRPRELPTYKIALGEAYAAVGARLLH